MGWHGSRARGKVTAKLISLIDHTVDFVWRILCEQVYNFLLVLPNRLASAVCVRDTLKRMGFLVLHQL